jgi:chemotaxis-related protein WspB
MQLLTFTVGDENYAIESRRVIEVVPLVTARPIPRMPNYVRGVFTHRGKLVPLVDLGWRLADQPLRDRLSTRVIVVEFSATGDRPELPAIRLGVVAENVVSLCSIPDDDASTPTMPTPGAPYLGRLLRADGRTLQMIAVEHLMPQELLASLVAPPPASPRVPVAS